MWRLITASVRHYWRTHLGVLLGAALATMVLTGSLLVGDSVKATLRRQAELRIGKVDAAMVSGDRFFREELANDVGLQSASVLVLRGSVARADGVRRVNQVQVLGVDDRFHELAPGMPELPRGAHRRWLSDPGSDFNLNQRLAEQLGAKAGDTLVLRVEKPGLFSRDAPLSGDENVIVAIRMKVGAVVSDEGFGRFGLQASQVPRSTIFLPLELLQDKLGFSGRGNLLLTRKPQSMSFSFRSVSLPLPWRKEPLELFSWENPPPVVVSVIETLRTTVAANWQLADASLELRLLPNDAGLELRTARVFLDPPVVKAAPRGLDALTYLVNELRAGEKTTPYSMVAAVDAPASGFLPAELADNEIVITQWLADDLGITTGGRVKLSYFVMGERRELKESSREFTVLAVLPMDEPQLNRSWMPDFPGLSDVENSRDWKPGFAIDNSRIRDKDEAYWDEYRGTPKAFVNITVGQQMWGNRWGNLTAIRYTREAVSREQIVQSLKSGLTPEQLGMQFIALREQALAATKAPVDFGQLFVSFSFFLIAAAAVLTGLLFVFSLEQRNAEAGLLLALGWRPKQVRWLFLREGLLLAALGSVLGALGAVLYTKGVLRALATVWKGAVGGTNFEFHASAATIPIGLASGVLIAFVAMWLASRRQLRSSARELLAGERTGDGITATPKSASAQAKGRAPARPHLSWSIVLAVVCFLAAAGLALFGGGSPGPFFGAGGLLLVGGILLALHFLRRAAHGEGLERITQLGLRNAARRRGRSLATIAVLACGVFMVVAVDSFRHGPAQESGRRDTGTGGFALIGESTLPIYDDLNTAAGREQFALEEEAMRGVSVVPMRVREGDDASCLNLNRALEPRLLGVKAGELRGRGAFRFADAVGEGSGWGMLDAEERRTSKSEELKTVPGIVDATTLKYALQMKLGDTIEYRDERGQPFQVRLVASVAGSILQGNVLISEAHFTARFPGHAGYRFFLIDAPRERQGAVREQLGRALQDRGFELTTATQRLADFQAVENTYLSIFQALGGLGLLLGSAGLAIVVARNVLERRQEFALLEAIGFRPGKLRHLVFAEHRWLILLGLVIGSISALLAVWPGLQERAAGFPLKEVTILLVSLSVGSLLWTWLAARLALRGSGVSVLRSE